MIKLLALCLLLVGCTDMSNTPIKKTEEFFKNYQILDNKVLGDLTHVIDEDVTLNEEQKKLYENIMKKQYENLTYKIKEDSVDGDQATVTVEIEVFDYKKILEDVSTYIALNSKEFENENGDFDYVLYNDYKLSELNKAKEKVKFTVFIPLKNVEGVWTIQELDDTIYEKINGNYDY